MSSESPKSCSGVRPLPRMMGSTTHSLAGSSRGRRTVNLGACHEVEDGPKWFGWSTVIARSRSHATHAPLDDTRPPQSPYYSGAFGSGEVRRANTASTPSGSSGLWVLTEYWLAVLDVPHKEFGASGLLKRNPTGEALESDDPKSVAVHSRVRLDRAELLRRQCTAGCRSPGCHRPRVRRRRSRIQTLGSACPIPYREARCSVSGCRAPLDRAREGGQSRSRFGGVGRSRPQTEARHFRQRSPTRN